MGLQFCSYHPIVQALAPCLVVGCCAVTGLAPRALFIGWYYYIRFLLVCQSKGVIKIRHLPVNRLFSSTIAYSFKHRKQGVPCFFIFLVSIICVNVILERFVIPFYTHINKYSFVCQLNIRNRIISIRLNRLLGFNPATSNHYGIIQLYNQRINDKTSDEEIIKIRSDYLNWKNNIIAIFSKFNLALDDEQFCKLFSVDGMFGTLTFLGIAVDIQQNTDVYYETVEHLIDDQAPINQFQNTYRNILRGLKG